MARILHILLTPGGHHAYVVAIIQYTAAHKINVSSILCKRNIVLDYSVASLNVSLGET